MTSGRRAMERALTPAVRAHAERLFRYHDVSEPPVPADVIVGLGSYQLAVADHCARLHQDGVAPLVLFTGGLGNWTRDVFVRPEAAEFRDRAMRAGVPETAILVEPEARNLGENVTMTRRLLDTLGIAVGRIALVTKRNTTRRARLTFRRAWPEVAAGFQGPGLHWTEQAMPPRGADDIVDEMVGDLQRILVYPSLGHQVPDRVPRDVLASYRALVEAGYDRHLIAGQPVIPSTAA